MTDGGLSAEHPEYGFLVEKSVGLDYMGIWKVRIHGMRLRDKRPAGMREKTRVLAEKVELVWFVTEEHKPKKHEREPLVCEYGRSKIAFTLDELKANFDKVKLEHNEDYVNTLIRTEGSIAFTLKELDKLRTNISYCVSRMEKIRTLEMPITSVS